MITLTRKQREALHCKWLQDNQSMTYQQFRNTVQTCIGDNSVMVQWSGMWIGIETDGYTHS